jgi:hypothetical protein
MREKKGRATLQDALEGRKKTDAAVLAVCRNVGDGRPVCRKESAQIKRLDTQKKNMYCA